MNDAPPGPAGIDDAQQRERSRRGRRILGTMAAIVIAPVVLAYVFYYVFPREARTNYGELLPTQPLPAVAGVASDGRPFRLEALRGRWVIIFTAAAACDARCRGMLYATRQARTMQNADGSRVVRLWLVPGDGEPVASVLAEHPDLIVAHVPPEAAARLPARGSAILLVDPLGNQVLTWPADPDIKALARDLARLLKASRIG